MIYDPNIPGVDGIFEEVHLLMDMTVDTAWLEYRTSKGSPMSRGEVIEFARRQQLRCQLLERLLETERQIEFTRETLDDLASLP